jgi:hypothetical protein
MGMQATINLDVYVEQSCRPCDHARELAKLVQRRFPEARVRVVDLSLTAGDRPDAVFAVPTYMLNGELLSLGNPEKDELMQIIQSTIDSNSSHL